MAQQDRHKDIADCLAQMLRDQATDPYMRSEIRVEDFERSAPPTYGIVVSPDSWSELMGTNERDDIRYTCLVIRIVSSLGNDDQSRRIRFAQDVRLLFHRKRIPLDATCQFYSTVDFGKIEIPQEWDVDNNSVIIFRVNTIVRENRDMEY